jgi:hypothetical protein
MQLLKAMLHLIFGSAKLAIGWMGTTALAVVVLAAPFVVRLIAGFRADRWLGVKKAVAPASRYTIAIWTMLFVVGMGRFVYKDHRDLAAANGKLSAELQEARSSSLTVPPIQEPSKEPKNSLRRRVMRLADELEALLCDQNAALPTEQQLQRMTPEQKGVSNHTFEEATKKTTAVYLDKFRSRTVGIIAELKAKGLLTEYWDGPLEKGAEFRMLLGDEIRRLRELAYHLDGQDRVVRFYP